MAVLAGLDRASGPAPASLRGHGRSRIVDRTEAFLRNAEVLLLEGPGWCTPRTWKTARLLKEHASGHGVETLIESPVLMLDEHA